LKGKCTAGDDCKYAHSLDDLTTGSTANDDKLEISSPPSVKGGLFSRQTSLGTNASQDFGENLWSRQTSSTSWADLDEDDVQCLWSRQGTLDMIEDTDISSPAEDFDASTPMFSRQPSWADVDDEKDDVPCLWSGKVSLDLTSNTRASTTPEDSDDSIGAWSRQGADSDSDDDMVQNSQSHHASLGIVEPTQENAHCARLQKICALSGLKVSVKNTFLNFDDCKHDMICGTAARRVRSAA